MVPLFKIIGAVKATGEDVTLSLRADEIAGATQKAADLGMVVERLELIEEPQTSGMGVAPALRKRIYRVDVVQDDATMALLVGTGHIKESMLQERLNGWGGNGWQLAFMFVETRRLALLGNREAVVLIFEADSGPVIKPSSGATP